MILKYVVLIFHIGITDPNSFEKVLNKSNLSKSNWRKIIKYKYLSYNFIKEI